MSGMSEVIAFPRALRDTQRRRNVLGRREGKGEAQEGRCCSGSGGFVRPCCSGNQRQPRARAARVPGPTAGWMRSACPFPPRIPRPEAAPPHPPHPRSLCSIPLLPAHSGAAAGSAAQPPPGPARGCGMAEGEITTFSALTEKFNLPPGNYKKPKLLYCSNGGHFLRILPDGTVDGTRDRSDEHIQLQLSAESVGVVHIRSTQSGQYLAMDPNGLLYGSQLLGEECLFLERLEENHYNTYISKIHADKNWFVGLKKNGNSKLGPRTHYGQKAILFLPLPVSAD